MLQTGTVLTCSDTGDRFRVAATQKQNGQNNINDMLQRVSQFSRNNGDLTQGTKSQFMKKYNTMIPENDILDEVTGFDALTYAIISPRLLGLGRDDTVENKALWAVIDIAKTKCTNPELDVIDFVDNSWRGGKSKVAALSETGLKMLQDTSSSYIGCEGDPFSKSKNKTKKRSGKRQLASRVKLVKVAHHDQQCAELLAWAES